VSPLKKPEISRPELPRWDWTEEATAARIIDPLPLVGLGPRSLFWGVSKAGNEADTL